MRISTRMRAVPHYHSVTTLGTDVPRVVTERRERLHGLEWESPSRIRAVPHYHSATTLRTVVPRVVRPGVLHGSIY